MQKILQIVKCNAQRIQSNTNTNTINDTCKEQQAAINGLQIKLQHHNNQTFRSNDWQDIFKFLQSIFKSTTLYEQLKVYHNGMNIHQYNRSENISFINKILMIMDSASRQTHISQDHYLKSYLPCINLQKLHQVYTSKLGSVQNTRAKVPGEFNFIKNNLKYYQKEQPKQPNQMQNREYTINDSQEEDIIFSSDDNKLKKLNNNELRLNLKGLNDVIQQKKKKIIKEKAKETNNNNNNFPQQNNKQIHQTSQQISIEQYFVRHLIIS